jgi:MerR family transcriptional regulator, light-induced transcriptional regulator
MLGPLSNLPASIPTMLDYFTPRQVARALGVSESSLKRWCDKGMLQIVRTAGGHRRLPLVEVMRFLRASGHAVVRPELLGLPAAIGQGVTVVERARNQFEDALRAADEQVARRVVLDLYLTKHPLWRIGDEVISPAFRLIGKAWECGELAVYQERRACEIAQRILYELTSMAPVPTPSASRAIGGTLEGDGYRLSTMLCECVLREAGWRAESLGTSIPVESICRAVDDLSPQLCWVSISYYADGAELRERLEAVAARASAVGARFAVGGRALDEKLRRALPSITWCDRMKDLVDFAASAESMANAAG